VIAWEVLLGSCSGCFTAPSFALFAELASAWVCCPARRTVCGIIVTADPTAAHDAYHRFLRAGAWSLSALFEVLARALVGSLCRMGALAVDVEQGRTGARYCRFQQPVSPARPPNPACDSHRTGLSTSPCQQRYPVDPVASRAHGVGMAAPR
jgi:DDE superfamily endonuclease